MVRLGRIGGSIGQHVQVVGAIFVLLGSHASALGARAAGWHGASSEIVGVHEPTGCLDGLLGDRNWSDISFVDYDALRQVGVLTPADEVGERDSSNRAIWHSLEEERAITMPFFLDRERLGFSSSSVGISDMRCAVTSFVDSLSVVRLRDGAAFDPTNLMGATPLYSEVQDDVLTVSQWEPLTGLEPSSSAGDDDWPASEWHEVTLSALLDVSAVEGILIPRPDGARGVGAYQGKDGATIRFVWDVEGATAEELEELAANAIAASELAYDLDLDAATIGAQNGFVMIDVPAVRGFRAVQDAFVAFDSLVAGPARP